MKAVFTLLLVSLSLSIGDIFAQTDPLLSRVDEIINHLTEEEDGFYLLPPSTKVEKVIPDGTSLTIQLILPIQFLKSDFDAEVYEEMVELFSTAFYDFNFQKIELLALDENGKFIAIGEFLQEHQWETMTLALNEDPAPALRGAYTRKGDDLTNDVRSHGMLEEKTIWLSAGHGWKYDERRKTYKTQRHNSHGLVEDFTTAETINYYLLKYLKQAGANVWTVRERDMNVQEIIVDNDQGKPFYRESGQWKTSRSKGFQGKSYRYSISNRQAKAAAHFTPNIPESGWYWVSVYYVNGTNRSVDTRYKIVHAGGESMVSINQEVHGNTWVYLGQFYFEKGSDGKVVLVNESSEKGQAIIADAIRFGGGKGQYSGEPRYEEAAQSYAAFQGFPYRLNDVMVRPHYAEWELAKGTHMEKQNSVYLSWHTNASPNRQSGSESFIHSRRPVRGSQQLQKMIHAEMISGIRKQWDPHWKDRGTKAADFGELRGLKTMPGVLLEVAFHDHPEDADALSTPAFRNTVARSVYKGIVRYFAAKDHRQPIFLPEPPTHVSAKNKARRTIQLDWQPPQSGGALGSPATGYKIFYSLHPKGFASFVKSRLPTYTFRNLKPGTTYFFKVVAYNEGGESFASPVVAARTPSIIGRQNHYLIVDGFDRLDKGLAVNIKEKLPAYAPLGNTRRLLLDQMNTFDYTGEHARALATAGVYFDGATNEAIEEGSLNLNDYQGIDWFLGRESVNDEPLSFQERKLLTTYLENGGNLIISGSEIAYAMDFKKQGRSFYHNYLKAVYRGDDAWQNTFAGEDLYHGLQGAFGEENQTQHLAKSPDIISATKGGKAILRYRDGKVAAVGYRGKFGVVNFAFPLESIDDHHLRGALLQKAVLFFNQQKQPSKELDLVELPEVFHNEIKIKMDRSPEGEATFQLYNPEGEEVLATQWNHNGNGHKIFSTKRLPAALYQYRFELLGLEQRGFLLKK